jgi:hypothetical protein
MKGDNGVLAGMKLECGQFEGSHDEQADQIIELIFSYEEPAIVMEDFELRQLQVELSPVQIASKVEYELHREALDGLKVPYFLQKAALAKSTVTDARLKQWGLWVVGQRHARDGIRHCITFNRRCKENRSLLLAAWPSFR